jgi:nucleotide-binding universal stress UspA family protein
MKRIALPRHRASRPVRRRKVQVAPAAGTLAGLKIKRILVPLDFSDESHKALNYAVALAADMRAKIILLHVIEPVYMSADPGLSCLPQQMEIERRAGASQMGDIALRYIPKGQFEKALVRAGDPSHEIVEAARRLKVGMIVITTHGRTGLSHVLMASTAETVVRHAPCPVLTVRRTQ